MKSRFIASLAILTLAVSGAFSIRTLAQSTDEGPAPSDQPSAPMEIGQAPTPDAQPNDSEPRNGQMGYPQPGDARPSDPESNDSEPSDAQPIEAQLQREPALERI